MKAVAFIDASNLSYGGQKSLGWSIDYAKLREYLTEKYGIEKAYYFGGIEIHGHPFDYLKYDSVPISQIERYLSDLITRAGPKMTEAQLVLADRHLKRVRFYRKLAEFGYRLVLKPVKSYEDDDGNRRRKANCDVDMAFYMMKEIDSYNRAVVLSGDGDFLPVLKHLRSIGKEVIILARSPRTAKEIKQFAGADFRDFEYLRERIKQKDV
ncbi:NYN domain-containing protein [Candidatus Kaiserbacteria bacterium]|nr:NYN domain-containing protein [Candidatus Kaiserbacteria bacterium]